MNYLIQIYVKLNMSSHIYTTLFKTPERKSNGRSKRTEHRKESQTHTHTHTYTNKTRTGDPSTELQSTALTELRENHSTPFLVSCFRTTSAAHVAAQHVLAYIVYGSLGIDRAGGLSYSARLLASFMLARTSTLCMYYKCQFLSVVACSCITVIFCTCS